MSVEDGRLLARTLHLFPDSLLAMTYICFILYSRHSVSAQQLYVYLDQITKPSRGPVRVVEVGVASTEPVSGAFTIYV